MKTQLYFILTISLLTTGCVPQADCDKLARTNERLQSELDSISREYENLSEAHADLVARNQKKVQEVKKETFYTDEDAINYIKDYYSFYKAGVAYRNVKVRKREYNWFDVSLDECDKRVAKSSGNDDFFWHSSNLRLVINEDGTYQVTGGLIH